MMIRPSSEQIDREILNAAARTFAVHGYTRTSVQQLADAVGYSKTGLLHRFASKQILYATAVEATAEAVEAVLRTGRAAPAGDARAVVILESVTENALNDPGLVTLLVHAVRPASGEPAHERLRAAVDELLDSLCAGRTDDDNTGRLRAVLALDLIVTAVATQDQNRLRLDRSRLEPLVVALAAGILRDETPPPSAHEPSTTDRPR